METMNSDNARSLSPGMWCWLTFFALLCILEGFFSVAYAAEGREGWAIFAFFLSVYWGFRTRDKWREYRYNDRMFFGSRY